MADQPFANLALVLHAHLPYVVAHGRWPHGADWLNECAAESYVPLLDVLYRLRNEGTPPKITINITPVLAEQLADDGFKQQFIGYLEQRIESAIADRRGFERAGEKQLLGLASYWQDFFTGVLSRFRDDYQQDIIGAFRRLQDEGAIEIMTCAATHGYLPLLGTDEAVQAQVKEGVACHRRHFGRAPRGFWLPECAYRPRYEWASPVEGAGARTPHLRKGIEEFLSENGLDYFIIDSALLMGGQAVGVYIDRFEALKTLWQRFAESYRPLEENSEKSPYSLYLAGSATEGREPVAIFTRDEKTGIQVWSGDHGYPGDGWYLDFHKKHFPGGHRYWRVTSPKADLANKSPYEPHRAAERVPENAGHFKELVKEILRERREQGAETSVVCAPYDAELFGHWWFEGPEWLYHVLKWVHADPEMRAVTCSEYLDEHQPSTVVSLPEGSWGQGGFHWIWLNEWTNWTWRRVYEAEEEFRALLNRTLDTADDKLVTILKQTARELLLLESSDWQFLISTWSARDYAETRAAEHFNVFKRLAEMASRYAAGERLDEGDWTYLGEMEERDRVFPILELDWFRRVEFPPR